MNREDYSPYKKGLIMRTRCGLLGLNANVWRQGQARICSLCNKREEEDIYHLLGACPLWRDVRRNIFGVTVMSRQMCVDILNVGEWDKLYNYIKIVLRLRNEWVNEYNY